MKTRMIVALTAAAAMLFIASLGFAQPGKGWRGWRGSGGWGMGSQYQGMYNPSTVETVSGVVEAVDKMMPMKGMHSGIHLTLKTDKETVDVHLGPDWYIERLDTKIEKGDTIEVKGSRVTIAGKPAIIAAEIKKGDSVLVLRDGNGIPAWAGWRR
ncbi:MAG TPA: DNA-binding protein [Nitrospirota bacterium]|nr:DNA-binding protein [Nitrospirota bacterium]